jgi:LPXTG-site transpeptidase (sortase) family protein
MSTNKGFLNKGDIKFTLYFFGVFLVTFFGLYSLGLVPSELMNGNSSALDDLKLNAIEMASDSGKQTEISTPAVEKVMGEEPVRITIPAVDINVIVLNPTSKVNSVLDEYLTRGAIRYPDSALLGDGNVLIFGHSSNWAVVQNQAYKALNGIDKLKAGDLIYVDSDTSRYTYAVTSVVLVNADKEFVDFGTNKNMLTISTCNTFGQKQDRYVAEAEFVNKEGR